MIATFTTTIDDLVGGSLFVQPRMVTTWETNEDNDEADEVTWSEATRHTSKRGVDMIVIFTDGRVRSIVIDESTFTLTDWTDFDDQYTVEHPRDDEKAWISLNEWESIFDNDVDGMSVDGPGMMYFMPCHVADGERSAVALVDLAVVPVAINGETGLALSGGGQDMSWDICAAYIALGQLPPVHYARDLPRFAGIEPLNTAHRFILDACKESLRQGAARLTYDLENLTELFPS